MLFNREIQMCHEKYIVFAHKILMQDFTKTFRQVVPINETNK